MRLHRFIRSVSLPGVGSQVRLDDEELVRQLRSILRLEVGDSFVLCDGQNTEAQVQIERMSDRDVSVRVQTVSAIAPAAQRAVTLYCALLRRRNFEFVVQKATEAGVTEIVPLLSERVVKQGFRRDRLETIIREAAEQSGRGSVPNLLEPVRFLDAIEQANDSKNSVYLCDASGEAWLSQHLSAAPVSIFIGPEGGWTDGEVAAARERGIHIVSLGATILRAETAAIVASYIAAQVG